MAINLLPLVLASQLQIVPANEEIILESIVVKDSNKTKLEEKIEASPFKGSFHGKIGRPWGYGLDFLTEKELGQGEIGLHPYLNIDIDGNKFDEKASIGFIGEIFVKSLNAYLGTEANRGNFENIDTTKTSDNIIAPVQNGLSWRRINQIDVTKEKRNETGHFFGTGINLGDLKSNNKVLIQLSNSNYTTNDKIKTVQNYNENYKDSTYTNQGIIVVTKTDLITRVLTENDALIKNEQDVNQWRFSYEHDLNKKIRAGMGAALQNHSIETDVRNITNIESYLNGLTIVRIIGNQTHEDTIYFSDYNESKQYSRIADKEQINTDLLSLILHINKDKNPNYRAVFDKAFFNSRDWAIKQVFNGQAGSWLGSLGFDINNSSFGWQLFWAKQFYNVNIIDEFSNYIYDKEELQRNFALNELQKQIKQKYNDLNFLKRVYGVYGLLALERIGGSDGDWKLNSELGYNVADGRKTYFGIAGGFKTYREEKGIEAKVTINDVTTKAYLGWGNSTKVRAELILNQ
ncbi:MAG: hypothetical protein N3G19_01610 [Candidatus Pacearchaeota archaeon]|nr:hypothetical protein [Candidatus Pacearchaeota archaeon]